MCFKVTAYSLPTGTMCVRYAWVRLGQIKGKKICLASWTIDVRWTGRLIDLNTHSYLLRESICYSLQQCPGRLFWAQDHKVDIKVSMKKQTFGKNPNSHNSLQDPGNSRFFFLLSETLQYLFNTGPVSSTLSYLFLFSFENIVLIPVIHHPLWIYQVNTAQRTYPSFGSSFSFLTPFSSFLTLSISIDFGASLHK